MQHVTSTTSHLARSSFPAKEGDSGQGGCRERFDRLLVGLLVEYALVGTLEAANGSFRGIVAFVG